MNEIIFEVVDAPEGGYNTRTPGASNFTGADRSSELREAL